MPKIKKEFGEGQSFVSSFEKPDDLRSILVEIAQKLDELIEIFKIHTHAGGAVPDQTVSSLDIEIED